VTVAIGDFEPSTLFGDDQILEARPWVAPSPYPVSKQHVSPIPVEHITMDVVVTGPKKSRYVMAKERWCS